MLHRQIYRPCTQEEKLGLKILKNPYAYVGSMPEILIWLVWAAGDSHVQSSWTVTGPGRKHTHIRRVSLPTALIQASPGISTSAQIYVLRLLVMLQGTIISPLSSRAYCASDTVLNALRLFSRLIFTTKWWTRQYLCFTDKEMKVLWGIVPAHCHTGGIEWIWAPVYWIPKSSRSHHWYISRFTVKPGRVSLFASFKKIYICDIIWYLSFSSGLLHLIL